MPCMCQTNQAYDKLRIYFMFFSWGKVDHTDSGNAVTTTAEYRQVHRKKADQDAVCQSYKVYDLVHSAADQARAGKQLFR